MSSNSFFCFCPYLSDTIFATKKEKKGEGRNLCCQRVAYKSWPYYKYYAQEYVSALRLYYISSWNEESNNNLKKPVVKLCVIIWLLETENPNGFCSVLAGHKNIIGNKLM